MPGVRLAYSPPQHLKTPSENFDRQFADGGGGSDFTEVPSSPLPATGLGVIFYNAYPTILLAAASGRKSVLCSQMICFSPRPGVIRWIVWSARNRDRRARIDCNSRLCLPLTARKTAPSSLQATAINDVNLINISATKYVRRNA